MKKLARELIATIRADKISGLSLGQISKKYDCSKSTVSYYCRDLFSYATRVYQTEEEVRKRLAVTRKRNKGKIYPSDYKKYKRNTQQFTKPLQLEEIKKPVYNKKQEIIRPITCPESPTGSHRWIINRENLGTCFYCTTKEQMALPTEKYLY